MKATNKKIKSLSTLLTTLLTLVVLVLTLPLTACSQPKTIEVPTPIPCDREHDVLIPCNRAHEVIVEVPVEIPCDKAHVIDTEADPLETEADYSAMIAKLRKQSVDSQKEADDLQKELLAMIKAREAEEKRIKEEEERLKEEELLKDFKAVNWIKYGDVKLNVTTQEIGWFVIEMKYYGTLQTALIKPYRDLTLAPLKSMFSEADLIAKKQTIRYECPLNKKPDLGDIKIDSMPYYPNDIDNNYIYWTVTIMETTTQTIPYNYLVKLVDNTKVVIRYPDGSFVEVINNAGFEISWME